MDWQLGAQGFGWGIVSAISLPLGAVLGLWLKPNRKVSSALMAFGAGALLFALTIELFAHVPHHVLDHGYPALYAVLAGAVGGGLLFELLNRMLNSRGAYLRRLSYARRHIARLRLLRAKKLVRELSRVKVLRDLPPKTLAKIVDAAERRRFEAGESLFHQGDAPDGLYFLLSGKVEVAVSGPDGAETIVATFGKYETVGELGALLDEPRTATVRARKPVTAYQLGHAAIAKELEASPALREAVAQLAISRRQSAAVMNGDEKGRKGTTAYLAHTKRGAFHVTVEDIHEEARHTVPGNAALAIWLGILIDGVPESLVIGMFAVSPAGVSLSFIVGVFLANLPEAMSSSVSMRSQGMKILAIIGMWTTICLVTGLGAFLGSALFPPEPQGISFYAVLFIEGLAAGAMLTMIAETMLPEAFEQGGSIVGLSTLAGFLTTLVVKVL